MLHCSTRVCEVWELHPLLQCTFARDGPSNLPEEARLIMMKFAAAVAGMAALALVASAQSQSPAAKPKFEVAAIRLSKDCDGGGGATKSVSPLGRSDTSSPGRLSVNCATVMGLIQQAYVRYANGRLNQVDGSAPISGGPSWINSERYDINAKAEGSASLEMMSGPMLQALLEDRFKLKMRRETREIPVYDLTVTKGGPKLKSFEEGSCTPATTFPPPPPAPGEPPACNAMEVLLKPPALGGGGIVNVQSRTLDDFSKTLGRIMGRVVVNKTGIPGKFYFYMEFTPDETTPGIGIRSAPSDEPPGGRSIFTAIQEDLGLKLESAKGPGEFLILDSVERPSEN